MAELGVAAKQADKAARPSSDRRLRPVSSPGSNKLVKPAIAASPGDVEPHRPGSPRLRQWGRRPPTPFIEGLVKTLPAAGTVGPTPVSSRSMREAIFKLIYPAPENSKPSPTPEPRDLADPDSRSTSSRRCGEQRDRQPRDFDLEAILAAAVQRLVKLGKVEAAVALASSSITKIRGFNDWTSIEVFIASPGDAYDVLTQDDLYIHDLGDGGLRRRYPSGDLASATVFTQPPHA